MTTVPKELVQFQFNEDASIFTVSNSETGDKASYKTEEGVLIRLDSENIIVNTGNNEGETVGRFEAMDMFATFDAQKNELGVGSGNVENERVVTINLNAHTATIIKVKTLISVLQR